MVDTKTLRNLEDNQLRRTIFFQDRSAFRRVVSAALPLEVDLAVGPVAKRLLGGVAATAKRHLRAARHRLVVTVQDLYLAFD
jgi:hypothetical protein